jgi:penicillin-binding protein 1A
MEEEKKPNKKKKNRKSRKVFKIIILSLLGLMILAGVAGFGVALAIVKTAPPLDVNAMLTLNEPSTIYDSQNQYMDDVSSDEKRSVVSIKELPSYLPKAFVSIEDERFEKHKGIDIQRILGVIYIDVVSTLKGNPIMQGASTITQQLVRNTMLTNVMVEKNFLESATRKIREMYLAVELEKHLSKEQILEAYMNTIPFGGTVHGVQAAATYYFNKPIKELTIAQAAYLAGVPQAPGRFNAHLDTAKKNPTPYLNRTKLVLNAMLKSNVITNEEYDAAVKDLTPEKLAFNKPASSSTNRLNYEWFSLPAVEQVKKDLQAQYKYSETEINNLLMYGGLKIYTTMDKNLQDAAQAVLNDNKNYDSVATKTLDTGIIDPQSSAVIMDYHTGEVKVIIGGRGEQPARSFNRAAYNGSKAFPKPIGSTMKPLTVYGAAIDSKLATAGTVVEDSPVGDEIKKGWNGYDPRNVESDAFSGYVTIREAITRSINLVAVKQEYAIGLKTGAAYGEKFGLTLDPKHDQTSIAAMALGELYDGENTLSISAAYGVFGNNGMYTEPRLYTKVVDRRGVTILESKVVNRKVLSPQANYIMYDLLRGPVTSGTATRAKVGSMPVAGKTGTTGDKKELWFAGFTPYYSGAVWIGHDKPSSFGKGISSGTAAAIWSKIMTAAHKDLPVKNIERPSGIISVSICKDSGKIPTDLCSRDMEGNRVYSELFISGTQPTTLCDIHVEAEVNKVNGKLATENTPKELLEKRVFIKRDYIPKVKLDDQFKVLPTELDDTLPAPPPTTPDPEPSTGTGTTTPGNNGSGTGNDNKPGTDGQGNPNTNTQTTP